MHALCIRDESVLMYARDDDSVLKVKVNSIYEFYLVLWDIFQQSTELSDAVTDAS